MIDPTPFITGLVGAFSAYATYKAAVAKAEAERTTPPAKSDDAAKGEQTAPLIKAAVQQHGDDKDRTALAQFEADPDDYRSVLEAKLIRLAQRNSAFAQQLQTLAQNAGVQGSGVQGNVNVSGGMVNGAVTGVNTGTISGTYTFGKDEQKTK